MVGKRFDTEDMEKKWAGHVFHGCTVKQFLSRVDRSSGAADWQIRAECVCGRLFECRFSTLKKHRHPSCGCRQAVSRKDTWNRIYSSDEKTKANVERQREKDEAAKASPRKRRTEPSVLAAIGLSERRLAKLWEKLDHEVCCPAWRDSPDKFVAWALLNGWARGRTLVRLDDNMPWHPLNVRWEDA